MGRNAEIETETEMLKRILALLFSFAGMAERVSVRSYPVRCLVLWLLRPAEAIVRDWLMADSADGMQIAPSGCAVLRRNSQAEAMFLAQSFHALAHMLTCQLHSEQRLARRLMRGQANHAAAGGPRRLITVNSLCRLARTMHVAMRCLRGLGFEAAQRLDTS